jgi:CRISPR-associated protein Cas1
MKVVIADYGVFVGVKDGMIHIKKGEDEKTVASGNVNQIVIATGGVSISSSLLRLAFRNNINIIILGGNGAPMGMFSPLMKKANVKVRKEQYKAQNDGKGLFLSRCFVRGKIMNQYYLLKSIIKNRKRDDMFELCHKIKENLDRLEKCEAQEELIQLEAKMADIYWQGLSEFYEFEGRKKRYDNPDPFNMMLNYGYSVLMSRVSLAIDMTNLDPYAGFLHMENPRRPALVVDLMEEFRQPVVDRAILKIKPKANDGRLTKETIKSILSEIEKRLETKITFNNRKLPIEYHIVLQARRIERFLLGKEKYSPFILR